MSHIKKFLTGLVIASVSIGSFIGLLWLIKIHGGYFTNNEYGHWSEDWLAALMILIMGLSALVVAIGVIAGIYNLGDWVLGRLGHSKKQATRPISKPTTPPGTPVANRASDYFAIKTRRRRPGLRRRH